MDEMSKFHHHRPTLGIIPGWQVHAGIVDGFLPEVFRGIQAAARERECNIMLAYGMGAPRGMTLGRPAWPVPHPDADFVPVGPWNTDGLIVIPPLFMPEGIAYLRSLIAGGFPVVFAGDDEPGPSIIVDNAGGIRIAFEHLLGHGHRQIAYIAGWADRQSGDNFRRLTAYRDAVSEAGMEVNPDLIGYGYHSVAGGRQAILDLLARKTPFTAVITSNDDTSVGVMQGLRDAGLLVPQDIAVIGFDDRMVAKAQVPLLTTVRYPMYELGYHSVELLLDCVENGMCEAKTVQIPVRMVVRESCGCLPGVTIPHAGAAPEQDATEAASQDTLELLAPGAGHVERLREGTATPQIFAREMTEAVFDEMHWLSQAEVTYLCQRIVEAFTSSMAMNRPNAFRHTIQQILERVSSMGEDLYAWQAAVTFLRDHLAGLTPPVDRARHRRWLRSVVAQCRRQFRRTMAAQLGHSRHGPCLCRAAPGAALQGTRRRILGKGHCRYRPLALRRKAG